MAKYEHPRAFSSSMAAVSRKGPGFNFEIDTKYTKESTTLKACMLTVFPTMALITASFNAVLNNDSRQRYDLDVVAALICVFLFVFLIINYEITASTAVLMCFLSSNIAHFLSTNAAHTAAIWSFFCSMIIDVLSLDSASTAGFLSSQCHSFYIRTRAASTAAQLILRKISKRICLLLNFRGSLPLGCFSPFVTEHIRPHSPPEPEPLPPIPIPIRTAEFGTNPLPVFGPVPQIPTPGYIHRLYSDTTVRCSSSIRPSDSTHILGPNTPPPPPPLPPIPVPIHSSFASNVYSRSSLFLCQVKCSTASYVRIPSIYLHLAHHSLCRHGVNFTQALVSFPATEISYAKVPNILCCIVAKKAYNMVSELYRERHSMYVDNIGAINPN